MQNGLTTYEFNNVQGNETSPISSSTDEDTKIKNYSIGPQLRNNYNLYKITSPPQTQTAEDIKQHKKKSKLFNCFICQKKNQRKSKLFEVSNKDEQFSPKYSTAEIIKIKSFRDSTQRQISSSLKTNSRKESEDVLTKMRKNTLSENDPIFYFCLEENVDKCKKCQNFKETKDKYPNIYQLSIHDLKLIQNYRRLSESEDVDIALTSVFFAILDSVECVNPSFIQPLKENPDQFFMDDRYLISLIELASEYCIVPGHIYFSLLKNHLIEQSNFKFFYENKIIRNQSRELINNDVGVKFIDEEDFFSTYILFGGCITKKHPDRF